MRHQLGIGGKMMNNFESKQFGDVPLEAYFMTRDEKGLLQSFQKKDSQTAKNLLTKQLVTFNLYDEILITKEPKFKINF
jgi:hypothetical protein